MPKNKMREYVICPCCGKKNYDRERELMSTPIIRRSVGIRYFYCNECGCSYVNAPQNIGRFYAVKKARSILTPIFVAVSLAGITFCELGADFDDSLFIVVYIIYWCVLIFILQTYKSPPEQRKIKKADNGFVMISASAERIGENSGGFVQEKDCRGIRFIPEGQFVYTWNIILPEPNAEAFLKCENAECFKSLKINYMYKICGENFSAYAQITDIEVKNDRVALKLKIFRDGKNTAENYRELFTLEDEKLGKIDGLEYIKNYT